MFTLFNLPGVFFKPNGAPGGGQTDEDLENPDLEDEEELEDDEDASDNEDEDGDDDPEDQKKGAPVPKKRFEQVLGQRNDIQRENEKLKKQIKDAEDAQKKADEKKLKDEEKFEELADQREAERDTAVAALETATTDLEKYKEALQASVDARIEQVPEAFRSLIPKNLDILDQLEWLDDNAEIFGKPKKKEFDPGGRRRKKGDGATLDKDVRPTVNF